MLPIEDQKIFNMRNLKIRKIKMASIKGIKMGSIRKNKGKIILLSIPKSQTEIRGLNSLVRTQAVPT